ncbi:hypothetical protein DID76_00320 [Candidatus Marinamargulisbacteria bacterium SCGC AG-414-C22]|nr:hypothetical protein DID76_00320 [Candidatus Marinamargulisbacteria bacterium SCGC AG-414-C22]
MHDYFFDIALTEARKAYKKDEVPIGCVIVHKNQPIAKTHNLKQTQADCLAHAEMLALTQAQHVLGDWRLTDCDIYITLEPCIMCAGAILHARLANVYYGAKDSKWGAETTLQLFSKKHVNHLLNVHYIDTPECSHLLSQFFKGKRSR